MGTHLEKNWWHRDFFMVWIFVSSHSSDCNHHMSSALFLLRSDVGLSDNVVGLHYPGVIGSAGKKSRQDEAAGIDDWLYNGHMGLVVVEAQNPMMDPHVERCKNQRTLSQIQTLQRRTWMWGSVQNISWSCVWSKKEGCDSRPLFF